MSRTLILRVAAVGWLVFLVAPQRSRAHDNITQHPAAQFEYSITIDPANATSCVVGYSRGECAREAHPRKNFALALTGL
jgi:hypothetical protein